MSNHALGWLLAVTAALQALNCLYYISQIGKDRKPVNPNIAPYDLVINGLMIGVIVVAAGRMLGG